MTDRTLRGRFVWHELVTPDTAAGHKYYNSVFQWKTVPWDQDSGYTMFATGGERIGGTAALTEGTPHWLHYIGTPDLEASLALATSLGATVVKGPTVIADDSRYAVLTDPQGALFALYSSTRVNGEERTPRRGEFSWMELASTNANEALRFYCELFGWERTAVHDMGPLGFYYLFGHNGRDIGGAFDKPVEMPGPPAWLGYIRGKDLDTVVAKARAGGGTLINGPMEVPGGDWIAQFIDPQGAMFAVHVIKADVEAAKARVSEPAVSASRAQPATKVGKIAARKSVSTPRKSTSTRKRSTPIRKKAAARKKGATKKKTVKRSGGKAVTVRSRSRKVNKVKATPRKKSGSKKVVARPKKGK
ncbi:VOC family protein [Povalibacter sp.]|uniref:VOC family protein n=1 Tax=Povalibacter sp. TaxID=1962978 RepID=UPI002F427902